MAALPLLALSFFLYSVLASTMRDNVRDGLLTSARTLASLVDNEIETHAAIAAMLAQSPALAAGDLERFWHEASEAQKILPGSWIGVSDPQGNKLLSTRAPYGTVLPRHADPDVVRRGFETGKFQIANLVRDPVSRQWSVDLEAPVFRNGQPAYSVGIRVSPARFLNLIKKGVPDGGIVAVIDRGMKFVARIPDHENRLGTPAAPGWQDAIRQQAEGWVENISVEGNAIMTGYTPTAHGWTVGVAEVKANLNRPLYDIFMKAAAGGLLLLALSLVLAWWLAKRAGVCMKDLADAARALGSGKPIPQVRMLFAEAGIISKSLSMASAQIRSHNAALEKINSELEDKVAERTRALTEEMRQREQAETALRQTQKMEAIGQLTGGIAHDFNNMLTIVIGNLDTIRRRIAPLDAEQQARLSGPVEAGLKGARSAAKLTQRLLAFARQQPLAPVVLDIRVLVAGMSDMLTRTVGEKVRVETVSGAGLWPVMADENQLESALLNLVVNARDAMPEGGRITIETSNAYLDENYVAQVGDIEPGQYVMLSVSDTGEGIPQSKLLKVFEPFFTTKEHGRGTGLGLAMVYGFVKQSGGHIRIYSEVGHGTTVKMYFPRVKAGLPPERPEMEDVRERFALTAVAGETILLVEDDDGVRDYAAAVLEDLGYAVRAAPGGEEALAIARSGERIDLLFTDVVLGGSLNGRQLAEEIARLRPELPVLFTTGYTRNAIVHHGRLDEGVELLTKPYASNDLAEKIRQILDRQRPPEKN